MNIILEQLGGNKFIAMTGARNFLCDGDKKLEMKLPQNMSKANRLIITLDESESDTYKMVFSKFTPGRLNKNTFKWVEPKEKIIEIFECVYNVELQRIFSDITGMDTKL